VTCVNDEQFGDLSEKLDAIAKLLALTALSDRKTLSDKAMTLSHAGFRPKDIGWLLGKDSQRVRELLYRQRKR